MTMTDDRVQKSARAFTEDDVCTTIRTARHHDVTTKLDKDTIPCGGFATLDTVLGLIGSFTGPRRWTDAYIFNL